MTVQQLSVRIWEILSASNAEIAPIESELLLRHVLKIDRVRLYQALNDETSPEVIEAFWQLVKRRINGEPIAYITGHREFYGNEFYVNPSVLIPRPETELLVEKTLELAGLRRVTVADIGTGSGAIAISLALNLPEAKIYATDISPAALKVAGLNCQKCGVEDRVLLLEGDMLNSLPEPVDFIVANLPYVKQSDLPQVNTVGFEPVLALDGGTDGLEKIRQLCLQVSTKLRSKGSLLLEIGYDQSNAVTDLLNCLFPAAKVTITQDLGGIDRVVTMTLI